MTLKLEWMNHEFLISVQSDRHQCHLCIGKDGVQEGNLDLTPGQIIKLIKDLKHALFELTKVGEE